MQNYSSSPFNYSDPYGTRVKTGGSSGFNAGNLTQTLFGGSRSSSESKNLAYPGIAGQFGAATAATGDSANLIAQLLGGNATGFNNFKQATGFDALTERGSRGITGNAAAGGLLRSGSTGMALQDYGQEMQNKYAGDYLNSLFGLGEMGLKSGELIAGAGKYDKSKSRSESGGLGGALGTVGKIVGGLFSDPRLKMDVDVIDRFSDGLALYTFRYIWDDEDTLQIGVMADEVAELRPWALGPEEDGFMTVDYDKLFDKGY